MNSEVSFEENTSELQRLSEVLGWIACENFDLFAFVKKYKFKNLSRFNSGSTSPFIFINRKLRIVLKIPFTVEVNKIPSYAIPTLMLPRPNEMKLEKYYNNDRGYSRLVIQSLGSRRNVFKAYNLLRDKELVKDAHSGNVAWFNKSPVWIDW